MMLVNAKTARNPVALFSKTLPAQHYWPLNSHHPTQSGSLDLVKLEAGATMIGFMFPVGPFALLL
jgi:hypothetical protein